MKYLISSFICLLILSFFTAQNSESQVCKLMGINPSKFPEISMDFMYFDSTGKYNTDFSMKDIIIKEIGNKRQLTDVSCSKYDKGFSVIFVFDISSSMKLRSATDAYNYQLAIDVASNFIDGFYN